MTNKINYSHHGDPIVDGGDTGMRGYSRNWGDASQDVQDIVRQMIGDQANRRGLSNKGRRELVRPGMRVTAEIKTGDRKVIDDLPSPVTQAVKEAGRER